MLIDMATTCFRGTFGGDLLGYTMFCGTTHDVPDCGRALIDVMP